MAFFDDLGKKFAQAGQATAQKTKELGDIARLNSLVSEEEKKISNTVYQIGELYLKLHFTDYDSDFSELIHSIKESHQTISEAKQQIQALKGVSHCDKCGAEVGKNMAFCSTCGNKINIVSNHIKCSSCGALVAKDMRFCTSCGKPMAVSDNVAQADKGAGAEISQKFKVCPSCGEKTSCEEAFCTECGNKL